jgi:hypothetical protein
MIQMVALSRQNISKSISALIVPLFCVSAIGALQVPQLNNLKNSSTDASVTALNRELELEKMRLNLLQKLPSLGFNNLIADWSFLNFLQYFGDDSARAKTGYTLSPEYFEVVLNRDPYFLGAYFFLSGSTTLYAGMPDRTIALMEKGLKFLSPKVPPQSYYIWRYKGTDELLFMGNSQAAKQSFETAAQWANSYTDAESQNVARLSRRTAKFLASNPESKSAQVSAWTLVLNNAFDDRTRQFAISKIRALGGQVSISPQGEVKINLPKKD